MSLSNDMTGLLFREFMPRKKEINGFNNHEVYDLKVYSSDYFQEFDPSKQFTKWALIETAENTILPKDMESYNLLAGTYAVFKITGSLNDNSPFEYIYQTWLPSSDYILDQRPHFDIMNTEIKNEQEIWIPIKQK